jgi:gamma-glutamylcyclotransferase (GGCT)/AIG2-like uncharacterized protein YtfP
MNHAIFTYGTLIYQEILAAIAGKTFMAVPASLDDFVRYRVRGRVFPGILQQRGASVDGVVYLGLSKVQLQRLDRYESDFYRRQLVRVQLDNGRQLLAWTYVVPEEKKSVLSREAWDETIFLQQHYPRYLKRCRQWARAC